MRSDELVRYTKKALRLIRQGRFSYLAYVANNTIKGIDLAFESHDDLGLSKERSNYYSNGGGPYLARVVKTLKIPPSTSALDVGCGKGGAVLTLCKFPYETVAGIDLACDLIEIARENARRAHVSNAEFICADAGSFTDLDRFDHLYLFNPFPVSVLEEFLANVRRSLDRAPRDMTLVYCNPVDHDAIVNSRLFTFVMEFPARETYAFRTYVHRH